MIQCTTCMDSTLRSLSILLLKLKTLTGLAIHLAAETLTSAVKIWSSILISRVIEISGKKYSAIYQISQKKVSLVSCHSCHLSVRNRIFQLRLYRNKVQKQMNADRKCTYSCQISHLILSAVLRPSGSFTTYFVKKVHFIGFCLYVILLSVI
jgi:hypothetical protein